MIWDLPPLVPICAQACGYVALAQRADPPTKNRVPQTSPAQPFSSTVALPIPNDPALTFDDVQVSRGARSVQVPVTLTEPTNHTITLRWQAQNGAGTTGSHYEAAEGWLIFHPGEARKLISLKLKRDLDVGQTIRVVLTRTPNFPPVRQAKSIAIISGGGEGTAPIRPGDAIALPARPTGKTLSWHQDFADPTFCVTSSGILAGKTCWQGRPVHGLTQPNNKELGIYATADRFPGVTTTGIDENGKRYIQLERHPQGFSLEGKLLTYDYGRGPTPYIYASAMLQASKFPAVISTGSYVEARLRVDLVEGTWPAFWLLPAGRIWPPEIDIFEGFWKGERAKPDVLTMSMRWRKAAHGADKSINQYGTDIPVSHSVDKFDVRNWHTYGVHIEEAWLTYYVDDVPVWRAPAPFRSGTRWYPLFDVTTGGLVGEPKPDARLPVRMGLDWIKVWN